jgi:7-carboxy-7-deazaguanine synthase
MPERAMISEIFGPVVQGEGPIIGRRTIFVRTFGCDSRCEFCDTMYAVDPDHQGAVTRRLLSPEEIVTEVQALDQGLRLPITISGGNPAVWNLAELVYILQQQYHEVWVETQGTVWATWLRLCNNVVVSPKGPGMNDLRHGVLPVNRLRVFANNLVHLAFKVVVFSPADLDYAELIHSTFPTVPMYLSVGSPVGIYDKVALNDRLKTVIEWSLQRPNLSRAIVLPQLHALAFGGSRGV